jgi:hypothetical protein
MLRRACGPAYGAFTHDKESIMTRIKVVGLALLAILALGAFAATTALAEEGFLLPGGGKFTLVSVLGGETKFEAAGGTSVTCKKLDETHFEVESDKHAKVTLHWLECTSLGFPVNSLGDKSGEILMPVLLLVCLDPNNVEGKLVDEFGIAVEIEKGHLEVPALGSLIELNGRFLGAILTKGEAKLWSVEFLGAKGKQTVTKCLEGKSEKLHNLTSSTNHGAAEALSVNITGGLLQFDQTVILEDS